MDDNLSYEEPDSVILHRIYMKISSVLSLDEMGYVGVANPFNKEISGWISPDMKTIFELALNSDKVSKEIKKEIVWALPLL